MSSYVVIRSMFGRKEEVLLAEWLNQSGVEEVEYYDGGWQDTSMDVISPHLKFEKDEDAMAFVLAHGGEVLRTVPKTPLRRPS